MAGMDHPDSIELGASTTSLRLHIFIIKINQNDEFWRIQHIRSQQGKRLLDHVGRFGIGGIVALGHHAQGADAVRIVLPRQLHHLQKDYWGSFSV